MKTIGIISAIALVALSFSSEAFAGGSRSVANSNSNSSAWSQSNASNRNSQSTTFNDRLQAPGMGGFGGGGCPEGLMASFPGGGIGFQVQCREYKQGMKYGTVNGAFGRDGVQRWLCQTDKDLYTLPKCRALRIENAPTKAKR